MTDSKTSDFWLNRPTFITGCTGVLGSWLTRRLIELGADVIGLIRDWVPQSELLRSGTIDRMRVVRGDITDAELLKRVFSEYEIDTCFHLAAQTIVGVANRMPAPTFETNIRGTWNLLEAARLWGKAGRVLIASSDKAYGEHENLPYSEEAPLQGRHPYDVSKSAADLIATTYARTYALPVAITRCGNLFGGGDLNWNRIVPGTIRSLIHNTAPVIRSDGSPRRDYLYVPDIVDGYILLAEAMVDGALSGEAFNFGLDQPLSALEMVEQIIAASPYPDVRPVIQGQAPNEIQNQYLKSEKARRVLGWTPRHSLRESLQETYAWYARFFDDRA